MSRASRRPVCSVERNKGKRGFGSGRDTEELIVRENEL
jgi:hypothetical protein